MKKTNQDYWVKDIADFEEGKLYCQEALKQMPGLISIKKRLRGKKPLTGKKILGAGVVTYECANFALLLKNLGAQVRWVSDSLHYTIDSAAAYMAGSGIPIFAYRHMTEADYDKAYHMVQYKDKFDQVIAPDYLISDGAEMPLFLNRNYPQILPKIKFVFEQTTCGINTYYREFINQGKMNFRVIDINGSVTKSKFDNIYGSRESLLEGIQRSLNIQIAGSEAVIFGFGEVGKGSAQALKGLGAHVSIVEIDPLMAMQAHMEGYLIEDKRSALQKADIIVTATGCVETIAKKDFHHLKDNVILMNMSEHNQEIQVDWLDHSNLKSVNLNESCTRYSLNKKHLYVLSHGYVVNLHAGHGHPPTVMGTTYTTHLLGILYIQTHQNDFDKPGVYHIPREVDEDVARHSFPKIQKKLSKLNPKQAKYLGVGINGPYKRNGYTY